MGTHQTIAPQMHAPSNSLTTPQYATMCASASSSTLIAYQPVARLINLLDPCLNIVGIQPNKNDKHLLSLDHGHPALLLAPLFFNS
jgi:hypothetical protein